MEESHFDDGRLLVDHIDLTIGNLPEDEKLAEPIPVYLSSRLALLFVPG
jgi:hypothetical protein